MRPPCRRGGGVASAGGRVGSSTWRPADTATNRHVVPAGQEGGGSVSGGGGSIPGVPSLSGGPGGRVVRAIPEGVVTCRVPSSSMRKRQPRAWVLSRCSLRHRQHRSAQSLGPPAACGRTWSRSAQPARCPQLENRQARSRVATKTCWAAVGCRRRSARAGRAPGTRSPDRRGWRSRDGQTAQPVEGRGGPQRAVGVGERAGHRAVPGP